MSGVLVGGLKRLTQNSNRLRGTVIGGSRSTRVGHSLHLITITVKSIFRSIELVDMVGCIHDGFIVVNGEIATGWFR